MSQRWLIERVCIARVIRAAAGLDPHTVLGMVATGRSNVLAEHIAGRQVGRAMIGVDDVDWDEFIRSATEINGGK